MEALKKTALHANEFWVFLVVVGPPRKKKNGAGPVVNPHNPGVQGGAQVGARRKPRGPPPRRPTRGNL